MAGINAGWLPYLADESVRFVHYSADRVRRQFGLDQDILDDFSSIIKSLTFVRPFLWHIAFEFWSRRFSVVTIPGSQRGSICTAATHWYWQAVMTLFEQELLGSHEFSLIPPDGLSAVIFANFRLHLPTKFVVAYAKK